MFTFEFYDYQLVAVLGISILAIVFILCWYISHLRSVLRPRLFTAIDECNDSRNECGPTIVKKIEALEDVAREVEGRAKSKIAALDRLIGNADREIIRLQQVLAESRRTGTKSKGASRQPDVIVQFERRDAA
jgi:hypothetical protein